jgi:hypothetical protein
VALVAVLTGACSDSPSHQPTNPATTPAPATTTSTADPTPSVVTTIIPFSGGINGPVSPGPTEPASR